MPYRGGVARWARRVFGLLATAAFLGVGVVSYKMIAPDHASSGAAAPTATPTATPTPHHHHVAAAPRPKPLTPAQKRARRAAVAVLRDQGYTTLKTADYDPRATFRVLVGRPVGNAGGGYYAFFFDGTRFLGRDALSPSASLKVIRHTKTRVTLSYGICCPSAHVHVRFRLQDGAAVPQQTVPASYLRAIHR